MKTKFGITQGGIEEGQGAVHDKGHQGDGIRAGMHTDLLGTGGDKGGGHHQHGDGTGGTGHQQLS